MSIITHTTWAHGWKGDSLLAYMFFSIVSVPLRLNFFWLILTLVLLSLLSCTYVWTKGRRELLIVLNTHLCWIITLIIQHVIIFVIKFLEKEKTSMSNFFFSPFKKTFSFSALLAQNNLFSRHPHDSRFSPLCQWKPTFVLKIKKLSGLNNDFKPKKKTSWSMNYSTNCDSD